MKRARKIKTPAPISSRFLYPRPPLLLSAPNQNRHATQANDLVKSKIFVVSGVISETESESKESGCFYFLPTLLTTPSLTSRLWSSENQIVGVGSRSGRINQSQRTFPRVAIGLVLRLLLAPPTTHHKLMIVNDGVVSGIRRIRMLFSLDRKVLRL